MNNNANNTVSIGNFTIKKDWLLLAVAVILIIAVIAVCFFVFFKTDVEKNDDVITAKGGGTADINLVYLMISKYKAEYTPVLVNEGVTSWNDKSLDDGMTWADRIKGLARTAVLELLTAEYLYDDVYKLPFTTTQKQAIEAQINAATAMFGSKAALENELSSYAADIKTLERYYELSIKHAALYDYLYGNGGTNVIPEESIKDYFSENYVIVDHIFLSTAPVKKADGTYVSITEEQFNEKLNVIKDLYDRITLAGEDFYALKEQYNEDTWQDEYYPNGLFVTTDNTFPVDFTVSALQMPEGDYAFAQTQGHGIHLIHKLPMKPELYNTNKSVYQTIKEKLSVIAFTELINTSLGDQDGNFINGKVVTVSKEIMKKIDSINVLTVKEWALG